MREAHISGLKAIALTDHDTLDGLDEAEEAARSYGIRFIPGIELEASFAGKGKCHILGLGIRNPENLDDFLKNTRQERNNRNIEIIRKMNKAGLSVSMEEIDNIAAGKVTGRPHFARWFIARGMAKDMSDAFNRWIGVGKPYYCARKSPIPEKIFEAIHCSGGKAVIAHPHSLMLKWSKLFKWLSAYRETGLDGVEAYHSGTNIQSARKLEKVAIRLGMIFTGGSDFHEPDSDRSLGIGAGKLPLNDDLIKLF